MTVSELDLMRRSARFWQDECGRLERDIKDIEREYINSDACWNAVIGYMLGEGYFYPAGMKVILMLCVKNGLMHQKTFILLIHYIRGNKL